MSESKEPPRLPDVVDEAGPSPRWLPWLGVGLLCAFAALIAARQIAGKDGAEPPPAELAPGAGDQAAAGTAAPAAKP